MIDGPSNADELTRWAMLVDMDPALVRELAVKMPEMGKAYRERGNEARALRIDYEVKVIEDFIAKVLDTLPEANQ